jgi:putative transposase
VEALIFLLLEVDQLAGEGLAESVTGQFHQRFSEQFDLMIKGKGQTSVGKYMIQLRKPSQTWRTFLDNHVKTMVSVDFFTVPTIRFQTLYVFLVLAHDRRRILHFNVTAHPTAEWTGQQRREAFPFDQIPRYLPRDRDEIFGFEFTRQVKAAATSYNGYDQSPSVGIEEVLSAPRSPWQRAYVEQ